MNTISDTNSTLITGFLLVNKPAGISSSTTLSCIKRWLPKYTKVGHAGTLDMFATGLLIIGIGRPATRMLGSLLALDKQYRFTAKLGELTDTLDHTGTVIEPVTHDSETNKQIITRALLERAIKNLGTTYMQTPPIYSALKHEGIALSKHARAGQLAPEHLEAITRAKSREVTLHSLTLLDFEYPFFNCEVHVSKGTYVRSLAYDIAQQIGTVATTYTLERTAIGSLTLEQALALDDITSHEHVLENLIAINKLTTSNID